MNEFEKTIIQYEEQAKADARSIRGMFLHYKQETMEAMQKAERLKLSKKHADNGRWLKDKIDERARAVERQIREKKYPLATSVSESEKLRGSLDYNTAMTVPLAKTPLAVWREAVDLNRNDLAFTLGTRMLDVKPTNEDEARSLGTFQHEFKTWLEKQGITGLESEQKELASVRKRVDLFIKQAEYDLAFDYDSVQEYARILNAIGV